MSVILRQKPSDILHSVFGYNAFRGQQQEIIDHIINGGDALILMPTGGGKSLCYQIPALCLSGVAVVVSPLIALMQDQVDGLKQLGIKASVLNSTLSSQDSSKVEEQMRKGELDIVYVSPERLNSDTFQGNLSRCKISLFAIDEAHCVSQWGHDFRPEYIEFSKLHEKFPEVPRIALTATADKMTRQDIIRYLNLSEGRIFVSSFDRSNINYKVMPKNNEKNQLLNFLNNGHTNDSGIIYCISRNKVMEITEWLRKQGFDALPYHAGLTKEERTKNQARFIKDENVIIVATIAFGMGINKPDVRFVAHLDLPKSIESYYQETGRAGRDGLPSEVLLLYGVEDIVKLQQFIKASEAAPEHKILEQQKLNAMIGYAETTRCRRQILLEYFGENPKNSSCGNCDACQEPMSTFDATVAVQKALSCIYRTGQIFGVTYLINVLLGKEDEKIKKFNHNEVSTFGIGKEYNRHQWKSIFRQIIALGLVNVEMESYGSLKLTQHSKKILKGEEKVSLRIDVMTTNSSKPKKIQEKKEYNYLLEEDQALFQQLRSYRLLIAKEQNIAPFMIFHDSTLIEMAIRKPENMEQMSYISGVGQSKLERYGRDFLEIIRKYCFA